MSTHTHLLQIPVEHLSQNAATMSLASLPVQCVMQLSASKGWSGCHGRVHWQYRHEGEAISTAVHNCASNEPSVSRPLSWVVSSQCCQSSEAVVETDIPNDWLCQPRSDSEPQSTRAYWYEWTYCPGENVQGIITTVLVETARESVAISEASTDSSH